MNFYHAARRNGKSEAIRQAVEVAERMGANVVIASLYGIQTKENRANAKAIDVEFREVKEPKQLTNGEENG
jgi:uncharacterized protein YbjQ (UPF0145 family)